MKLFNITLALGFALVTTLFSCKKENDNNSTPQPTPTTIVIELEHVWGATAEPFEMDKEFIQPMSGEKITFRTLRYYLSNVKLKKTDGSWWSEPESYRLIDAAVDIQPELEIKGVPTGDYTEISFTIGVDSTRNVSGAQDGALSPSNGMFWSWNTGYIFIKAEGDAPASATGSFAYHIGGFKDPDNAIQVKSFVMPGGVISIKGNAKPQFHFLVNAARFWHGGIKTADVNRVHMPGPQAVIFSTNFANGVVLDHIHQ